jgi:ribosomal protein L29
VKFKELVQMTGEEQIKKLKELELELIKLNAQVATGTPPKNAGQLRRLKKDIARIMLISNHDKKTANDSGKKSPLRKKADAKDAQRAKKEESPKNREKKAEKQK